jgi:streptogramin lyase
VVVAVGVALYVILAAGSKPPPQSSQWVVDRPVQVGPRPNALTIADGILWALSYGAPYVDLVAAGTGRPGELIHIGRGGSSVATGFGSVWVAKGTTNKLLRFDAHTHRRKGQPLDVSLPSAPSEEPVAVATGGGAVWVGMQDTRPAYRGPENIVRIDPNNTDSKKVIPVKGGVQDLAVGAGAVWVSNRFQSSVVRIGARSETPTPIDVGLRPYGLAVGGKSVWVAVASAGAQAIARIDVSSRKAQKITLTDTPTRVTVGAGSVWVTARAADRLIRIDPNSKEREIINTGSQPFALAVAGKTVWLSLLNGNAVQRVRLRP